MSTVLKNFIILFVITSIIVMFLITNFQLGILRVPLIIGHLLALYFFNLKFKLDLFIKLNLFFLIYVVVQSLVIQSSISILLFVQAIVSVVLYVIFYLYSLHKSQNLFTDVFLRQTSTYTVYFIPLLLVSLVDWNILRNAGILGNPNLTSHTMATILPFSLMVKRSKTLYIVLSGIVLYSLYSYASRSALLAIIFGVLGYWLSLKNFKRKGLMFAVYSIVVIYLSYNIVDLIIDFLSLYGRYFNGVDSRLLYTGYNGRDILFEQAYERFEGNEFFGLGFDGSKFELGFDHVLSTHNGFLEILLRLGYGGMIIFGVILFYILLKISQVKESYTRSAAFMSFVVIMSLSTNSSTFYVFNYYFYYLILIYCIAVFNKIRFENN